MMQASVFIVCLIVHKFQLNIKNLWSLDISWDMADELAMGRVEWRRCVSRCADMHRMDYCLR